MSRLPLAALGGGASALLASWLLVAPAHAQNWPTFYDPFVVRDVHLTMSGSDWNTVRNDMTFDQEVPAYLNLPGEPSVLVAVRRKSGAGQGDKVPIKIDINEFVPGQSWKALKKMSFENGADTSVLLEGFAWYLHRLAWVPGGYPYMPGLACWSRLYVNGAYIGLYANVEQVDKRFLENRGSWLDDDTWLYKASDVGSHTLEFGGPANSPTYTTLCYAPFPVGSCPTPAPAALATQLNGLIDMQGMLALGAVNIWSYSPDNLFSKGKNHFFSDHRYDKRRYYSWDMDANFGSLNATRSIYEVGNSSYEDLILDNATFRTQFNGIMRTLINGPFSTANLVAAVDALQPILLPAWSADPNAPGSAGDFDDLREFIAARNNYVLSQLPPSVGVEDEPLAAREGLSASPNPFRTSTRVQFELEREGPVQVAVFDTRGARIRMLAEGPYAAGRHQSLWNGSDESGRRVPAGLYFIRVATTQRAWSEGIVLLN